MLHAAGITREDAVDWRTLIRLEPKDWEITRWYLMESSYRESRDRLAKLGWQVTEEDRGPDVQVESTGGRGRAQRYVVSVTYKYAPSSSEAQPTKEFWQ